VSVKTCDEQIAQENNHLKKEVKKLELEVNKLKKQAKVQPTQDNCNNMVKKLEKGKITPKIASQPPKKQVQNEKDEKVEYARSVFFIARRPHINTTCHATNRLYLHKLLKKATKKPSGQCLGLICDESLTCLGLNLNLGHFDGFTFIFVSFGESRLLFLWCAGDRCGMAGSDEDHGRSRRPSVEDWGWPGTGWVLSGRTIERSGDVVCGLYRARGDEGSESLS
jgi:hypothetical protein